MSEATAFTAPSGPTCMRCGQVPELVQKVVDPQTNRILRMYQCECGQRLFDERSRLGADRPRHWNRTALPRQARRSCYDGSSVATI